MALLLDFIAIVFIVIISYLFCNSNYKIKSSTNNSSCLLSHIVVGFSVIIFYKLSKHIKLNDYIKYPFTKNNEYFDNIGNFINNSKSELISPQNASTLSPTQLTDYSNKLDSLILSLNNLQKTTPTSASTNINPANLSSLDLSTQQQYQMFQTDFLNKQVKNVQDILNAQTISDTTINYKPIKVFSSCIVSNANGTTTSDIPVSNNFQNVEKNTGNAANAANAANNIMKTISQSNGQTQGPLLSSTTGLFNTFLTGVQDSGIVNVNT